MKKDARISIRANQEVIDTIKDAADLCGISISSFITDAAVTRARKVILDSTQIRLSSHSAKQVFDAIEQGMNR